MSCLTVSALSCTPGTKLLEVSFFSVLLQITITPEEILNRKRYYYERSALGTNLVIKS